MFAQPRHGTTTTVRNVVVHPPLRRPSGPHALRTLWGMDFTHDKRLSTLQTPTLVVWGARGDKVNKPSGGQMLVETMPHCELVVTSGTGHWVQWERADLGPNPEAEDDKCLPKGSCYPIPPSNAGNTRNARRDRSTSVMH